MAGGFVPKGDPHLVPEWSEDPTEGDWRVEYRQGAGVPGAEEEVVDYVPGDPDAEVEDYVPGRGVLGSELHLHLTCLAPGDLGAGALFGLRHVRRKACQKGGLVPRLLALDSYG